ncbi:formate dehydrogenase subunit gamma [Pelomonas cellulosilytica]|uniref:Formate dehydrogenase subunit gamma n=1 Tax=Pelomonas cellulosilytica TaxID=2906762 RepID=A0ABS8XUK9_9BURK|nr:formate dehydrogenase subunit gamma [Pelomonas sp. P8]MCE4554506.1 formate dehydrogenase subunit gamma [Pelomonas sp. P8]
MATRFLLRYSASERTNHWLIVLFFLGAGLSGLAFFHPSLFFLSGLFGGGTWARILHPFMGVLMAASFIGMFVRLWRHNVLNEADREWVAHSADMLRGDKASMPPVGRYNAGQKGIFWVMALSLLVLVVTGFMFWQPWFANAFPILLRRIAVLLHAASATALIFSVIIHIYAAIWVKGTIRAMTRGTVTEGWARQNHALWHREMTGKQ